MGKLFGTDGIRGVANKYPITPEIALKIGKAAAHLFREKGASSIIIGKDTRTSGPMLEHAIISGVCSCGVNAVQVGHLPTPGVAFLTRNMQADAGIMISASHNPYEDNGLKLFSEKGYKLSDAKEQEIEDLILSNAVDHLPNSSKTLGQVYQCSDAVRRYGAFLKSAFPSRDTLEGRKIVLDCANGATYKVAPVVLRMLGAEVIPLFDQPDGLNINLHCGSQYPQMLAGEVVKQQADIGFAFDGDGDRVIAIDEKGTIITGDQIIAVCSKWMKKEAHLKNDCVVSTVMSNIGLSLCLQEAGIKQITSKVGDRYVLEKMQEFDASIGGEDSGHVIFLNHHTTGDGIITALQILAVMVKENKSLSELARIMQVFPQKLINIEVKDKPDLSKVPEIMDVIQDTESKLGNKGRVLVRYSGTQLLCRVMVEGPTQEETEKYCQKIAEVVIEQLN